MVTTWILICNASRARVFSTPGRGRPWTLIQELTHPESRLKGQAISADKPGRVQQMAGAGSRPAMEPPTPVKEVEAQRFAEHLAKVVENGHGHNTYTRLVLVAPPHFLGLLRQALSDQVTKRVTRGVDKDFTMLREDELPARLADAL